MLQSQIAIAGRRRKKRPVRHSSFGRNVRVKFCEAGALYCIVLDWIKAASCRESRRFAASRRESPQVAANCREKNILTENGANLRGVAKTTHGGKQSFLFHPDALI